MLYYLVFRLRILYRILKDDYGIFRSIVLLALFIFVLVALCYSVVRLKAAYLLYMLPSLSILTAFSLVFLQSDIHFLKMYYPLQRLRSMGVWVCLGLISPCYLLVHWLHIGHLSIEVFFLHLIAGVANFAIGYHLVRLSALIQSRRQSVPIINWKINGFNFELISLFRDPVAMTTLLFAFFSSVFALVYVNVGLLLFSFFLMQFFVIAAFAIEKESHHYIWQKNNIYTSFLLLLFNKLFFVLVFDLVYFAVLAIAIPGPWAFGLFIAAVSFSFNAVLSKYVIPNAVVRNISYTLLFALFISSVLYPLSLLVTFLVNIYLYRKGKKNFYAYT